MHETATRTIDEFVLNQSNSTFSNITVITQIISSGGVGLTVLINTVITVLLLLLYIFFLQPCVTLYNVEKKEKLLEQVMKENENLEEICVEPSMNNSGTNSNIEEDDLHSIFYETKSVKYPLLHGVVIRLVFIWSTVKTLIIPSYRLQDRRMTVKRFGRDVAVYILYQQQIIYALILCSFIGLSILLPVHLNGTVPAIIHDTANSGTSATYNAPLLKSSIEMRISQPKVLAIHVMLMILFCLIFTMFTICWFLGHPLVSTINYMKCDEDAPELTNCSEDVSAFVKVSGNEARPERFRYNMMSRKGNQDLYLVSPFCVSITGVPRKLDQRLFVRMIYQAAKEPRLVRDIQKVLLIPSLSKRIRMQEKLQEMKDKLDRIMYSKQKSPKDFEYDLCEPSKVLICCARDMFDGGKRRHILQEYDAVEYYKKHIELLSNDIERYDDLYIESFCEGRTVEYVDKYQSRNTDKAIRGPKSSGFGFIVFSTVEAAQKFLKYYSASGIPLSKISKILKRQDEIEAEELAEWEQECGAEVAHTPRSPAAVQRVTSILKEVTKQEQFTAVMDGTAAAVTRVAVTTEQLADGVLGKGRVAVKNIHRLDIISLFSLRVEPLDYEPKDIDWNSIFSFNKQRGIMRVVRQLFIFLLTIFIFILFSSPAAIASGAQSILKIKAVGVPVSWLVKITGRLGDVVFQYIPTLIILLTSTLIPIVIVKLTLSAQNITYSIVQRRILWRTYLYLVLSTLIIPSLLLTTLDGIGNYFTVDGKEKILSLFTQLFLPGSGAFFINVLIQKALLSNSLSLFRIGSLLFYLVYTRFTGRLWSLFKIRRHMTPLEKLKAAEMHCFMFEQEYAYMHWMLSITLAFSVFSPVVLPLGLSYFLYKYFIDRSIILDVYAHRRRHSLFGAAFGTSSDFISHHKMAILQCILMMVNMFIFAMYQCLFYASKLSGDKGFVVHTGISAAVSGVVLASALGLSFLAWIIRKRAVLVHYSNINADSVKITPFMSRNYFELAETFNYLPHVPFDSVTKQKRFSLRKSRALKNPLSIPLEILEKLDLDSDSDLELSSDDSLPKGINGVVEVVCVSDSDV
jgi:hypothetical protein